MLGFYDLSTFEGLCFCKSKALTTDVILFKDKTLPNLKIQA